MALAETAELAVKMTFDGRQVTSAVGKIEGRLDKFGSKLKKGLGIAVAGAGTLAAAGLVRAFQKGTEALRELELATAQTEAVIKSTGGVAGVSAKQVRDLAEKYEGLNAIIDDKVIQSAENLLLTFTNIREDAFEPALAAVLDFAQATGTDATSAAKLLGRALNDPVRGMTQLRRAGLSLDAATEKRIKDLAQQGKLYEAQTILLDELTKRYGGSFARAGETAAGKQAKLADAIEDVQKAFAEKLLPVVVKVSERITDYLAKPETLEFFRRLGDTIAGLFTDENLDTLTAGIETAASAVSVAIKAFNTLPPEIKALAIGAFAVNKVTGGAIGGAAEAFGKIIGAGLRQIFAANVTVIGKNVIGGGGGVSGGGGSTAGTVAGVAAAGAAGVGAAEVSSQILGGFSRALAGNNQPLAEKLGAANENHLMIAFGPFQALRQLPGQVDALINGTGGVRHEVHTLGRDLSADTRSEANQTQRAIAGLREQEQQSLIAFRAGERATLAGNNLARTANQKLDMIRRKPTRFTANVRVTTSTNVSVRDIDKANRITHRVAKTGTLVAS